ncbi:hypothetical protein OUZ56_022501 [Daphnia magna]|uniref:Secreted protein n=1 Tax=Daphnia magna TaxID=35525 RepID=A0ABR0AWV1_9CRUS|nr:hypothetical protein OUZ56_022501 [Daphnia magna]
MITIQLETCAAVFLTIATTVARFKTIALNRSHHFAPRRLKSIHVPSHARFSKRTRECVRIKTASENHLRDERMWEERDPLGSRRQTERLPSSSIPKQTLAVAAHFQRRIEPFAITLSGSSLVKGRRTCAASGEIAAQHKRLISSLLVLHKSLGSV